MEPKKILVVYFTQSGQMLTIARKFCESFASDTTYSIVYEELKPVNAYPFPWSAFTFFNGFPEAFYEKPIALQPYSDKLNDKYDLIILAYQPWFLTPSPVFSSFLQSQAGKKVLNGTKVVTLIGCRNMWLGAQEKVKKRLIAAGASLIANIALVDKSPNVVSVITILRWMLWGKKEKFWVFPAAGVSEDDVNATVQYGQIIKDALENNLWDGMQQKLNDKGAVEILPDLVMMESRGQRAFGIWSKFIGGAPIGSFSRKLRVYIFMILLPTAIFILSPLLAILSFLMLTLKKDELMRDVNYFKTNGLR
jgi:flavodoxin